jgi:MATE family multidrug resistance protein
MTIAPSRPRAAAPAASAAPSPAVPQPLSVHVAETVKLALPLIAARTGLILMLTVDTVMTGRLGGEELAFLAVGISPQITLMLVAIGALQATVVLTAQAIGAGEAWRAGAVLRAGLIHAGLLGVLAGLAAIWSEEMFLAIGQSATVAVGAAEVSHAFAVGLPGLLMYIVASFFLEASGRPRTSMVIILVANLVNIPLNGVLALGWGGLIAPMGADGAVLASSILRWGAFLAAFACIVRPARGGDQFGVLVPVATWVRATLTLGGDVGRQIRRLGLPMGIAQGIESSAFTTVVFIAGSVAASVAAAHQTTMTLVVLVYMCAIGFGGAAAIRVGRAVGRGNATDVRRAGLTAIALGSLVAIPAGIAFVLAPEAMVRLVTDDPAVAAIAAPALRLVGFFLVFDAANGITTGALRGMGEVWIPMFTQCASFWLVAVPLAWWFGVTLGWGPLGLIAGICAGMVASAGTLVPRFAFVSGRPPKRV